MSTYSTPIHNNYTVPLQNNISPILYPVYDSSPNHNSSHPSTTSDSGFITNLSNLCQSPVIQDDIPTVRVASPKKRRRVRRHVVKLPELGIKVMTSWYERNMEHPYPTYETTKVLAKAGNITIEQVQKWFSNRRMRDRNTKPLRLIAARRKRLLVDDCMYSEAKRICQ